MLKRRININWNLLGTYGKRYYNKFVNRVIFILIILLIILVFKMMDTRSTNYTIEVIKGQIYYEFNLKDDSKRARDFLVRKLDSSKKTIEELTKEIIKKDK